MERLRGKLLRDRESWSKYGSRCETPTRKLPTRPRKSIKKGTRGGRGRGDGNGGGDENGLEEWCDGKPYAFQIRTLKAQSQ